MASRHCEAGAKVDRVTGRISRKDQLASLELIIRKLGRPPSLFRTEWRGTAPQTPTIEREVASASSQLSESVHETTHNRRQAVSRRSRAASHRRTRRHGMRDARG